MYGFQTRGHDADAADAAWPARPSRPAGLYGELPALPTELPRTLSALTRKSARKVKKAD